MASRPPPGAGQAEPIAGLELLLILWLVRMAPVLGLHPEHRWIPRAPFWAGTLLAGLMALVLVPLYTALANRFPRRSLIQMGEELLGPVLGKALGVGVVWFFLHMAWLDTRIYGDMMRTLFLPRTPWWVITIPVVGIMVYALWLGFRTFAGAASAISLLMLPLLSLVFVLSVKDVRWTNLWPLWSPPATLVAAVIASAALFGELAVALMLHPFLERVGTMGRTVGGAIGLASGFAALTSAWSIGMLGAPNVANLLYPAVEIVRMVRIGEFVDRIEGVVMVSWVSAWFVKSGVFLFAAALGLAQILGSANHRVLLVVLGVSLPVGAWYVAHSVPDVLAFFFPERYAPLGFGFGYLLPAFLLAVAALRGKGTPAVRRVTSGGG